MRTLPLLGLCGCWVLTEHDLEGHDRLIDPVVDTDAAPTADTGVETVPTDVDPADPPEGVACEPRVFTPELALDLLPRTTLVTGAAVLAATDLVLATDDGWASLLSREDGGFAPRVDLRLAPGACADALVAVPRDSRGDYAAILDRCGASVIVLGPSDDQRGLALRQTLALDGDPVALAVGRFDADLAADLAVLHADGALRRFLLAGGERFVDGPADVISPAPAAPHLAAGDLDGDGLDDLALASGRAIRLLAGGDARELAALEATRSTTGVVIADVSGDGSADVLATLDDGTVESFLQSDGAFGAPVRSPVGGTGTVTATFEVGCTSAVVVDPTGDAVLFLRGLGDGSFDPATPLAVDRPDVVVVGQFVSSGEEHLDLAVLSSARATVEIFEGGAL